LLLVSSALRVSIGSISLRLLLHLVLQFALHLLALVVESHGFFALLYAPLIVVALHCFIPLGIRHPDHLTVICLHDLLVNIHKKSFLRLASGS
jgi:hypothetical protein